MPGLTTIEWDARFVQQARWTAQARRALFEGLQLGSARSGLEVGCGTGAAAGDVAGLAPRARLMGIDLRADLLQFARRAQPALRLARADGLALPFARASFDFSFCHYLLLWVSDPVQILREMARVTRPGGAVLALAEPDYGGRIDYPSELAGLGQQQSRALRRQGADPEIGRRLSALFRAAGLREARCAVLGGQWGQPLSDREIATEWQVLEADLAGSLGPDELQAARRRNEAAWQAGERVLYVPTFYAWGFVEGSAGG